MSECADAFMNACEKEDIRYHSPIVLEDGRTMVILSVTGSAGNSYDVQFVFDEDDRGVGIRVYGLVRADRETYADLMTACGRLNVRYRWVKFIVDVDMDVNMESDCVIDPQSAGEVCIEMFCHVVSIVRDAYPVLMKTRWG